MANFFQMLRSSVSKRRPPGNTRKTGELYVNLADRQLGYINAARQPVDLIAVPFHSETAAYVVGDLVRHGSSIYRCATDIATGKAFDAADWAEITANPQALDARYVNLDGDTMTGALRVDEDVTAAAFAGGALQAFRNILINGDMRINQRGVANWGAVADGAYGFDRWKKQGSTITQIIEGGNFVPGVTYTLSYMDGTTPHTSQVQAPTTRDWELTGIPMTATDVQLELGSEATPFERRPLTLEELLCFRYFWRPDAGGIVATGYAISATDVWSNPFAFPVPMRTNPSKTFETGAWSNGINLKAPVTLTGGSNAFFNLRFGVTTVPGVYAAVGVAGKHLTFDAEM